MDRLQQDIQYIKGIGPARAKRMNRLGLYTVRDIRERKDEIQERFGRHGQLITELAFGIDGAILVGAP